MRVLAASLPFMIQFLVPRLGSEGGAAWYLSFGPLCWCSRVSFQATSFPCLLFC